MRASHSPPRICTRRILNFIIWLINCVLGSVWIIFWYRLTTKRRIQFPMLSLLLSFRFFSWCIGYNDFWVCLLYHSSYLYFLLLSSVILPYEHIVNKLALRTSALNLLFGGYCSCSDTEMYNLIHLSTLAVCSKEVFWAVSNALDTEKTKHLQRNFRNQSNLISVLIAYRICFVYTCRK